MESDVGSSCGAHGRLEIHTKYEFKNLIGRDDSKDLGTDGRITIK
jgi:hypothetical protein